MGGDRVGTSYHAVARPRRERGARKPNAGVGGEVAVVGLAERGDVEATAMTTLAPGGVEGCRGSVWVL
jgi:hypothetical protein